MSTLKVETVSIDRIEPHPNADRLEVAYIRGWVCIVGKGQFKSGDIAVYIPIDAILTPELEEKILGNAKIKLDKGRVRTIKLRGVISQGILVDLDTVQITTREEGIDVTKTLGITKFEPTVSITMKGGYQVSKKKTHPLFRKYTDIENIKNYPNIFDGEMVVITEKVHGTNFRAGWVPTIANTWWKKIKKFFNILPEYEFVFGSHNVQLQLFSNRRKHYYSNNVYLEAVEKYNLKKAIPMGCVIYGEIFGDGIQNGYTYGMKNKRGLMVFDIMVYENGEEPHYLSDGDFGDMFYDIDNIVMNVDFILPHTLYIGPWNPELLDEFFNKGSEISKEQPLKEGIVIKTLIEKTGRCGRMVLKHINPEYLLLKNNTDFH